MTNCSCDTFTGSGSAPALNVNQSGTGLAISASSSAANYCIEGSASGTNGTGVGGISTGSASCGVIGTGASSTSYGGWFSCTNGGIGVQGKSDSGYGVYGTSYGSGCGGYFSNTSSSASNGAIYASGGTGDGIYASSSGYYTNSGYFYYTGTTGTALTAYCSTGAKALYAIGPSYLGGAATVSGYLTKSGGGYLVDHPGDPENKMLNHCFVESPEMKNVYDGVITLDPKGEAVVSLPSYFEAANSDFRYQLTAIGASMPSLFVSIEVANNQFSIGGGVAGKKVSWQVTGVRADKWALANHPGVEIVKKTSGTYLHPELFGADSSKRVDHKGELVRDMTPSVKDHIAPSPSVTTTKP